MSRIDREFNLSGAYKIDSNRLYHRDFLQGLAVIHCNFEEPNSCDKIDLMNLEVHQRNHGIGTAFMKQLCKLADGAGRRIEVVPSNLYGSDLERLKGFYRRFDFNEVGDSWGTMVRFPKERS